MPRMRRTGKELEEGKGGGGGVGGGWGGGTGLSVRGDPLRTFKAFGKTRPKGGEGKGNSIKVAKKPSRARKL